MALRSFCSLVFYLILGLSAAWAKTAVTVNPTSYPQFDWNYEYQEFLQAVKDQDNDEAADIGDGFIDRAAMDLNYHSPEFADIAKAIANVHEKNCNFLRAAELFSQAQAAYQYALGYRSDKSYEALYDFARMSLKAKDYDRAISLYEKTIVLAVIRKETADKINELRAGLAKSYAPVDPRIAQAIRK